VTSIYSAPEESESVMQLEKKVYQEKVISAGFSAKGNKK
jgi:hypothetical protein